MGFGRSGAFGPVWGFGWWWGRWRRFSLRGACGGRGGGRFRGRGRGRSGGGRFCCWGGWGGRGGVGISGAGGGPKRGFALIDPEEGRAGQGAERSTKAARKFETFAHRALDVESEESWVSPAKYAL